MNKVFDSAKIVKSRTGVIFGRARPIRSVNPYGVRKPRMHALKLYGPHKGIQNSYGAVQTPCEDGRFLFKTALEQPGNTPYEAQECDVTDASRLSCVLPIHTGQIDGDYCSSLHPVWRPAKVPRFPPLIYVVVKGSLRLR